MKFIHLSNVNLMAPELKTETLSVNRSLEHLADFCDMLKMCNESRIDALFITGNLFYEAPEEEYISQVNQLFSKLKTTRVFLVPGKQDVKEAENSLIYTFPWGKNVTVFRGDSIQRVFISRLNTEITGIGYDPDFWARLNPEKLTRGKKGTIQILLLPFIGDENSLSGFDELSLPFDYTGTGQKQIYKGDGNNRVFSPGVMEPMSFSTQLSHGFFMCTIEGSGKGDVSLIRQFIKATRREYMSLQVNLSPELDYEETKAQIEKVIKRYGEDNIYEIILRGGTSLSVYINKSRLSELPNVIRVNDETDREKTLENIRAGHSGDALGRFIESIQKLEDTEVREKALRYGVNALLKVFKTGTNEE